MSGSDPESDEALSVLERGYSIQGRVQGVGFRWWTRGVAVELGIVGTVRNRAAGVVEVMARGEPTALDLFEGRLKRGPQFARVDRIEDVSCALPDGHTGFTIEH